MASAPMFFEIYVMYYEFLTGSPAVMVVLYVIFRLLKKPSNYSLGWQSCRTPDPSFAPQKVHLGIH